VKVTRHKPYATSPNWVIEPKSVGPGVITARTLLSEDAPCVAVRDLNCTGDPVQLSKDVCVGTSLPAQVYEPVPDVEKASNDLNLSRRTGNLRGAQTLQLSAFPIKIRISVGNNRKPREMMSATPPIFLSRVHLKSTCSRYTSPYLQTYLKRND